MASRSHPGETVMYRPLLDDGTPSDQIKTLVLGQQIGKQGKSGTVFEINGRLRGAYVVKLYSKSPPPHLLSLLASLNRAALPVAPDFVPICTPDAIVVSPAAADQLIGVVTPFSPWSPLGQYMRRTDNRNMNDRKRTVRHLAALVSEVHGSGHAVGDLSPSNAFVSSDGRVSLIDVDSFGVLNDVGDGFTITPPHATANYSAPASLSGRSRDEFVLGVLILEVLLRIHPYGAVDTRDPDATAQRCIIARRSWLQMRHEFTVPTTCAAHPGLDVLPARLREIAIRTLDQRDVPSAAEWEDALEVATTAPAPCGVHVSFADRPCLACVEDVGRASNHRARERALAARAETRADSVSRIQPVTLGSDDTGATRSAPSQPTSPASEPAAWPDLPATWWESIWPRLADYLGITGVPPFWAIVIVIVMLILIEIVWILYLVAR